MQQQHQQQQQQQQQTTQQQQRSKLFKVFEDFARLRDSQSSFCDGLFLRLFGSHKVNLQRQNQTYKYCNRYYHK